MNTFIWHALMCCKTTFPNNMQYLDAVYAGRKKKWLKVYQMRFCRYFVVEENTSNSRLLLSRCDTRKSLYISCGSGLLICTSRRSLSKTFVSETCFEEPVTIYYIPPPFYNRYFSWNKLTWLGLHFVIVTRPLQLFLLIAQSILFIYMYISILQHEASPIKLRNSVTFSGLAIS